MSSGQDKSEEIINLQPVGEEYPLLGNEEAKIPDASMTEATGATAPDMRGGEASPSPTVSGRTDDRQTLLAFMYIRFREKRHSYSYSSSFYRRLDTFLFFLPLMGLQCAVAVVYVAATSNEDFQRLFSGCVSAVSAVLIAIQMKMKWGETSEQFNGATRQYALLASETFFKWLTSASIPEEEFQDFVRDAGQLEKEVQDTCPVPPTWITRKFERHRMNLTIPKGSKVPEMMQDLYHSGSRLSKTRRPKRANRGAEMVSETVPIRPTGSPSIGIATTDRSENLLHTLNNPPPPTDMQAPLPGASGSRLRMTRPDSPSIELNPLGERQPSTPSSTKHRTDIRISRFRK